MFHVRDDFRNRFKITAEEFNRHARFINNLSSGFGILVHRPDNPSANNPVSISLDETVIAEMVEDFAEQAKKDTGNNETDEAYVSRALPKVVTYVEDEDDEATADATDRIGTSNVAAPIDHQHSIPFWINPLKSGSDAANNVQSEDVYVTDANEDTSTLDTSGTSPYAARADHTHIFDPGGTNVTNLIVYQIYKPDGTSHYYALPYTLKFENGILTACTAGTSYDLYSGGVSPNVPTIS